MLRSRAITQAMTIIKQPYVYPLSEEIPAELDSAILTGSGEDWQEGED